MSRPKPGPPTPPRPTGPKTITDIDAEIAAEDAQMAAEHAAFLARFALGHIYVIEFTSGIVKVGKAKDPKARIAAHTRIAEVHGGGVRSSWVSRRLVSYSAAERDLIDLCSRRGQPVGGREYFRIDARDARTYASIIDHTRWPSVEDLPADMLAMLEDAAA